jgi:preprotein translocase subunit SecA
MEDQWQPNVLADLLSDDFKVNAPVVEWIEADHHIQPEDIKGQIQSLAKTLYEQKTALVGKQVIGQFQKSVILQTLDNHWREHLAAMDQLRQGIHLRGYAQKDPKQEYKREAFSLFTMMLDNLKYDVVRLLLSVELQTEEDAQAVEEQRRAEQIRKMNLNHDNQSFDDESGAPIQTYIRHEKKTGRNDPCPCGSGKKFKSCHGSLA